MKSPSRFFPSWSEALSPVLLVSLLLILIVIQFLPGTEEILRYQRSDFSSKLWQSVTHALVHLNIQHLMLNAIALFCIFLLFPEGFKSSKWLLALLTSAIVSSAGLYFYSPTVEWCVGLSGALHGLMVYVMLRTRASVFWMLALFAKIVFEQSALSQSVDIADLTADFIQHPVVVDAHLWGAVGGLLFFGAVRSITTISLIAQINSAKDESERNKTGD